MKKIMILSLSLPFFNLIFFFWDEQVQSINANIFLKWMIDF